MNRKDITQLHYITPIANVPSIMQHGLLSYNKVKKLKLSHHSVAMQEIQERRAVKVVPGGKRLHDYACLYFYARNPMLYKLKAEHHALCVLQINDGVLDLPGVVITDGNAASQYTAFWPSPAGVEYLKHEYVFAESWNDEDEIVKRTKKRAKCAEVLVPDCIPPNYILGAYVSCEQAKSSLVNIGFTRPITIHAHLFFM